MGLWETVKNSFDQDRQYFTYFRVPPNQVTDRKFNPRPLQAGLHYFRVWLPAMYLSKRVSWFQTIHPAVHSVISTNFGGQQNVSIPMLADASRLGFQSAGIQGEVIARNFPLTPILPFNGGSVTLQCGLMALDGYNHLAGFLKAMTSFSNLLAMPQLSTAMTIVDPLLTGIQDLLGAGNGKLHLGLMETFTAETLYEGYVAIIRATNTEIDPRKIFVARELLWYADGSAQMQPLPFDHMLLRIDVSTVRDDWDMLPSISAPYKECLNALGAQSESQALEHLRATLLAAFKAPELTQAHRRVVIDELKRRYATAKESLLLHAGMGSTAEPAFASFGMAPEDAGVTPEDAGVTPENAGTTPDDAESNDARASAAFAKGPIDFGEVFGDLSTI